MARRRTAAPLLDQCEHLQIRDGRAEVIAVMRGMTEMRLEGMGCVIGAKFRPGGFYPFVQRPVSDWTDRVVAAREVFGGTRGDADALARTHSDAVLAWDADACAHAAIVAGHLDAFLGVRVPAYDPVAELVALVALVASDPSVRRVGDLVRRSGRNERTLHRLFARYAGVTPASIIRRYRLQAAAARLTARPPGDAAEVAWDLGYADQAHFIRDFRATIGITPGAYVATRFGEATSG